MDIDHLKSEIKRINHIQKYINNNVFDMKLRDLISRPLYKQRHNIGVMLLDRFLDFVLNNRDLYNANEMKFFLKHPIKSVHSVSVIERKRCFRLEIGSKIKSKALLIPFKMYTKPDYYAKIQRWRKKFVIKSYYKD